MNDEIESMKVNKTWTLVPKPADARLIDYKWIYKVKEGISKFDPPRYKARLVAKGFTQREGEDYNEIFSLVVKYKTLRLLLAMTAVYDFELEQMDVKTAFLHGDLDETIYMRQPKGFIDSVHPNHACLLNKSIYGLKQSPRQWNIKFDKCMRFSLGFKRSKFDTCLYFKGVNKSPVLYVLLYVDDILLISKSVDAIHDIKKNLQKHFDMKDLGIAKKILGMSIIRDRKHKKLWLHQCDYVHKVLERFHISGDKINNIPLGAHLDLTKIKGKLSVAELNIMKSIPYDAAVGSVMYSMICTRPDLAFTISTLSRFMSEPTEKHWVSMKYLLRYLLGTANLSLLYAEHSSSYNLHGFVDADYASNKDTRKSITSYVYTWAGNCVSWKSQQQPIVALSSTEAEYIAATEACKEAIWLQGILKEIERKHYTSVLHIDSQSALYLCRDPMYHERTKHIDVRYHFIREKVEDNVIHVKKIDGKYNPADFGTKIVPYEKFVFCRNFLHLEDFHG